MFELRHEEVHYVERAVVSSGNAMQVGAIDTTRQSTERDWRRAKGLGNAQVGTAHDHYLSGILVVVDVKIPLYLSPQLQRYHWFEVISSQSTMHKIAAHIEHGHCWGKYVSWWSRQYIRYLAWRYHRKHTYENMMRLRSNLPCGFELWATITVSYLQLKTMYTQRNTHTLKEDWGAFCEWCDGLPNFTHLTGCKRT